MDTNKYWFIITIDAQIKNISVKTETNQYVYTIESQNDSVSLDKICENRFKYWFCIKLTSHAKEGSLSAYVQNTIDRFLEMNITTEVGPILFVFVRDNTSTSLDVTATLEYHYLKQYKRLDVRFILLRNWMILGTNESLERKLETQCVRLRFEIVSVEEINRKKTSRFVC